MPTKFEQALRAEGLYFDVTRMSEYSASFVSDLLKVITSDIQRLRAEASHRGVHLPMPSVAFVADTTVNAFATKIEDEC